MPDRPSTYPKAADHEFIMILRHADGGVCLRDSGDSEQELRDKANAEWTRTKRRLGDKKTEGMTLTLYRRMG